MKLAKVAFLDRDGVINKNKINKGYIGKIKDFKWIRGAKRTIQLLNKKNFKVVVVTNQSGVARGYFKIEDVKKLHLFIQKKLKKINAKIDKFYFCPYHIDGVVKKYKKNTSLRKPGIGMFKLAKKKWKIDLKNSFMIGDQSSDMEFAKRAQIKGYLFKQENLLNFLINKRIL